MKIQNAYGTNNKHERELAKVNHEMSKHFEDTFDCQEVLLNNAPFKLLIIKESDSNIYEKTIKSKHSDRFNLGDYVLWNNQMWLITSVDVDDKVWNSGSMTLCTILLRFQNMKGEIIERWACSEDYGSSSVGSNNGKIIKLNTGEYNITLPIDEETKYIKQDKRFPIDIEGVDPPDIYIVTERQVKLNDVTYFDRGGILQLTLSFDEFSKDRDKKIELCDGKKVWIADYFTPSTPQDSDDSNETDESVARSKITYVGQPTIRYGGRAKAFKLIDTNENVVEEVAWTIENYCEGINITKDYGGEIQLKIDNDDKLISRQFTLKAYVENILADSLLITIVD